MMKQLHVLSAVTVACTLAATTFALARPDARTMSCQQVRSLINQSGAVVLTTGQHTYDRYVAHTGFCYSPDVAMPVWIATADTGKCMIYNCQIRIDSFHDDWPRRW